MSVCNWIMEEYNYLSQTCPILKNDGNTIHRDNGIDTFK